MLVKQFHMCMYMLYLESQETYHVMMTFIKKLVCVYLSQPFILISTKTCFVLIKLDNWCVDVCISGKLRLVGMM